MIALAAMLLAPALFTSKVLLPFDALHAFEPWRSSADPPIEPANPLLLDQVIVIAPWLSFAAERLRAGELPLWNPSNYAGQPIAGAYQMALYWPLHWIYFAWPSWQAIEWIALAKLVLAGGFMLAYLRRLGLSQGAASVGAIAFMLSGFNVVWLNHNQASVAPFLPALLWAVERTIDRPGARASALFAALVALQFLAGHAQTSAHVLIAVALYAAARGSIAWRGIRLAPRGAGWLALGACVGVAIATPQIWPFVEYLGASKGLASNARDDLVARIVEPRHAILQLWPRVFGAPDSGDYRGPLGSHVNFNELVGGYVGATTAVLALIGCALSRGALTWFFVALAILGTCATFQVPLLYDALREIPGLASTKLMRLSLWTALAIATLAALGVEAMRRRVRLPRVHPSVPPIACCALVAAELLIFGRGYNPAVDRELVLPRTEVTDFLRGKAATEPPFRVVGRDNTHLIANANLFYGVPLLAGYDSLELERTSELIASLSSDPRGLVFAQELRYFDRLAPLASLLGVRYVIDDGRDPLPEPLRLVLDGRCKVYENPDVVAPVFLARSAEVVADDRVRVARLADAAMDPRHALLERVPDVASLGLRDRSDETAPPTDRVDLVAHDARSLVFDASIRTPTAIGGAPGVGALVVIAAAWAPGWRATADGAPIEVVRVDHALRGVWLPPGRWRVEMRYEPASTYVGLWIGGVALVILIAMAWRGSR